MIIERDISTYSVLSDDTVQMALKRIDAGRHGFVLCLTEHGVLEGVLSDGDVRRWLISTDHADLHRSVASIMNTQYVSVPAGKHREQIEKLLTDTIRYVPLLDGQKRLVGLARQRRPDDGLRIADRWIRDDAAVFVIAEIGINHNGCADRARRLIEAARAAGVDCVKFQMRHLDALYRRAPGERLTGEDLGAQYTLNLLNRFELPVSVMRELFDYSRELGLIPLCTPWEQESLRELEVYGMPAYKIASADLTNHPLVEAAARTYKPIIISTGMSTEQEIREVVNLLQNLGATYALLHCNSTYPAPFKDVNLNYLTRLREIGACPVGYSGHERGWSVALAAVAKGARIIEKHLTEDRSLEGSDHKVSLLPDELKALVEAIRQVEEALGKGDARSMSQGELMNRANLAKSLVINCDLQEGDIVEETMIEVKSPGRGLQPYFKGSLVGKPARRALRRGDFLYASDLNGASAEPRQYQFRRPWGVTVRWHDFRALLPKTNPDFLEFHLSFRDMDEEYLQFFDAPLPLDLKVHAPDIFAGDHLLDLANPDRVHRQRSIQELQRVVRLTHALRPFFTRPGKPVVIASLGGFSFDGLLSRAQVAERYRILADSLGEVDADGVEIIAQTLPPFPWYFGGQMYLNLFVHPEDTVEFCQEHDLRLCFDISHSKLTCNHFKYSFKEFTDLVAPRTAHLHIGDATGVDGEGLQIGEGDIDFPALASQLDALCPQASFIPEIWQGHKNEGEGFWLALERLEGVL